LKSGKLTKELLEIWYKEVFFPVSGNKPVLFIDSLTTYNNKSLIDRVTPSDKQLEILTIPPGTTGLVQALDKYGFRLWKNFVRRLSDAVLLYELKIDLYQRNNILKLQSLTHNQFSSPRFENLFKYSWFACGYVDIRPDSFEHPVNFCFEVNDKICSRLNCINFSFIICNWCKMLLCFDHVYHDFHFCDTFVE